MSTVLDDPLRERISFLLEQIRPENKPAINQTFKLQAEILQSVDFERLDAPIRIRRAHLKRSTKVQETDRLFAELGALE